VKGERLGEFEEFTLLAVHALARADEATYAVPVQEFVEHSTGRPVAMGAVYAALDRLEAKGFLRSVLGSPTPTRGGKRKRLFAITPAGVRAIRDLRRVRDRIWMTIEEGRRS
jgi:DNA-binding PadR family transcriptional regulator